MSKIKKPTKVLCKRTSTSGKDHWWDRNIDPPIRHERENRMFIEGTWYDVLEDDAPWNNDRKSFRVINSQENPHMLHMYADEEALPDHCDMYGPGDYAKWFYTPEELEQVENGTYNPSYKLKNTICVLVGNYHWVKHKEENGGEWVIAKADRKHETFGKHYWSTTELIHEFDDDYFAEIGDRVPGMESVKRMEDKIENNSELTDSLFPLVDAINKKDPMAYYATVEYHMQFVNKAFDEYFDRAFGSIDDSKLFF